MFIGVLATGRFCNHTCSEIFTRLFGLTGLQPNERINEKIKLVSFIMVHG